jgi:hypothetical protein
MLLRDFHIKSPNEKRNKSSDGDILTHLHKIKVQDQVSSERTAEWSRPETLLSTILPNKI